MNRGHRTFCRGDDCELRIRCHVTRCVHALDTRLLRFIYPHQTAFWIQPALERFMKVGCELTAEIEEQRIAFKRLTLRKHNTLQLLC